MSRASVELVFDNTLGRVGGSWSQYAEISVKRVLSRDGDSNYYINGTHVRRRDVQDIFLGTGLGPRAYSIIEQGMISRVITSKPEELRVFLEEAAGVSKYRERRRETELRLEDTRENLARVGDIRAELEAQLERLAQQAEVAARYQDLQSQLALNHNLLAFTRLREAEQAKNRYANEVLKVQVALEAETAKLRDAERSLEELRSRHYEETDQLSSLQGALYAANGEVQSLEQEIAFLGENRRRMGAQLEGLAAEIAEVERRMAEAQSDRGRWEGEIESARAAIVAREAELESARAGLPAAEAAQQKAAADVRAAEAEMSAAEQAQGVEETRESHALKLLAQLEARKNRLRQENMALVFPEPEKLAAIAAQRESAQAGVKALEESQRGIEAKLPALEEERRQAAAGAAGAHPRGRAARGGAEGARGAAGQARQQLAARRLDEDPRARPRRTPLAGDPRRSGLGRCRGSGAGRAPQRGAARGRGRPRRAAARRAPGQLRRVRRTRRPRGRRAGLAPQGARHGRLERPRRRRGLPQGRARERLHPARGRGRTRARARAARGRAAGLEGRPPLQPPGRGLPRPAVGAARRAAAPARDRGAAGQGARRHRRAQRGRVAAARARDAPHAKRGTRRAACARSSPATRQAEHALEVEHLKLSQSSEQAEKRREAIRAELADIERRGGEGAPRDAGGAARARGRARRRSRRWCSACRSWRRARSGRAESLNAARAARHGRGARGAGGEVPRAQLPREGRVAGAARRLPRGAHGRARREPRQRLRGAGPAGGGQRAGAAPGGARGQGGARARARRMRGRGSST